MGLMKDHVINQARSFVLACEGMRDETCAVPSMDMETRTIK